MESLSISFDKYIKPSSKENFIFKSLSTNITAKNINEDNDHTFKSLSNLRKNESIVVLSTDKESWTVILIKADYIDKINKIINEGIVNAKYKETSDTTYVDFKRLKDFLYRNFKDKKML